MIKVIYVDGEVDVFKINVRNDLVDIIIYEVGDIDINIYEAG